MAQKNVQFAVAAHIATILGYYVTESICTRALASSVQAEPSFVRRVVAKLAKAGMVKTSRGSSGACLLARPPDSITLLEIYRASAAPAATSMHDYPVEAVCPVSAHIRESMAGALNHAQQRFEQGLSEVTLEYLVNGVRDHKC